MTICHFVVCHSLTMCVFAGELLLFQALHGLFEGRQIVVSRFFGDGRPLLFWEADSCRLNGRIFGAKSRNHGIHAMQIDPAVVIVVRRAFVPRDDF